MNVLGHGRKSEGFAFWGLACSYAVFIAFASGNFETLLWRALSPVLTPAALDTVTLPAAMAAAVTFLPLFALALVLKVSGRANANRFWLAPLIAFGVVVSVLALVGVATESSAEAYISQSLWLDGALGALAALSGVGAGCLVLWLAARRSPAHVAAV